MHIIPINKYPGLSTASSQNIRFVKKLPVNNVDKAVNN